MILQKSFCDLQFVYILFLGQCGLCRCFNSADIERVRWLFYDPEKRERAKELLRPLHEAMTILAPLSDAQKALSRKKLNESCRLFPNSIFSTCAIVRDQASHCHFDILDDTTGTGMVRIYSCIEYKILKDFCYFCFYSF